MCIQDVRKASTTITAATTTISTTKANGRNSGNVGSMLD